LLGVPTVHDNDHFDHCFMIMIIIITQRGKRDMFSLPENLGVVAALQRCPTPYDCLPALDCAD